MVALSSWKQKPSFSVSSVSDLVATRPVRRKANASLVEP